MKEVYIKENGKRIYIEVTDEVEKALTETRRAIWRNDAKERYYCKASLDAMTDNDTRASCMTGSPEAIYIQGEERTEQKEKITAALKSLTPEQSQLVKLLYKGLGIREIARLLGKSHIAVLDMKKAIQKKFKNFLR